VPESVVVPVARPIRSLVELEAALASSDAGERARAAWEVSGASHVAQVLLDRVLEMSHRDPAEPVREAATWAYSHLEATGGLTGATQAFDELPVAVWTPAPQPPKDARAHRAGGDVVVEVLVSERGDVVHAEVRQSTEGLDDAALECARGWRFTPARAKGRPVACVARVSVRFQAFR
jgi:TonB family protein